MIVGVITVELEPLLNGVYARSAEGNLIPVRTILDTGFNGSFCMPKLILERMGLQPVALESYELADDSIIEQETYRGEIVINNQPIIVEINSTESDTALMGMAMLLEKEAIFNLKDMSIKVV